MKRFLVPGIPAALSLALSLSTVGTHIYWQDSGFYLNAVHDLGVLYPHGFVVYQLLCKVWTTVFFFLDFVLAVHLFSSACAAAAAGVIAVAARDLLRKDWPAVAAGCVAAAGYTFWFSGIYAKVYALLYLVLALLMLAIVRTAEAPTRRSTALVAGLAGLGWAVHPSVALGGLALLLYFHRATKTIGMKATGICLALGLGVAVLPALALPLLAARDVEHSLGHPATLGQVVSYLSGSRFTGAPGVFGLEGSRVRGFAGFLWEEYLLVGLVMAGIGIHASIKERRGALLGGLLWMFPYILVATLFKIEGQSDHWYVAACLPLTLAIAAGFAAIPDPRVLALLAVGAVGHSVVMNHRDLRLRNDDLAEVFGSLYLRNLEPDAVLFAQTDDVVATTWALQSVRGARPDVVVVTSSQLAGEELWYDLVLKRHHPDLKLPSDLPPSPDLEAVVAAYLRANAGGSRPLYTTLSVRTDLLPAGFVLVPQGVVWRLLTAAEDRVRKEHWDTPVQAEDVPARYHRSRGLAVTMVPGGFETEPEAYERRLLKALLRSRLMLADWRFRHGLAGQAVPLFESVLRLEPSMVRNEGTLHTLALSYLSLGRPEEAAAAFRGTLEVATRPWTRASSWLALGDIARGKGDAVEAQRCYGEAGKIPGLSPEQQDAVRQRQR